MIFVTAITLKALYHTIPFLTTLVGKGENAGNQHFILFPQCFLRVPKQVSIIQYHVLSSANAFNLDQSKILLFGKELSQELSY